MNGVDGVAADPVGTAVEVRTAPRATPTYDRARLRKERGSLVQRRVRAVQARMRQSRTPLVHSRSADTTLAGARYGTLVDLTAPVSGAPGWAR